ncbi:hypothetical protein [Xanthobacter sediminis]
MSTKVGEATIRGKQVSFFTPPHNEPDFLWVDMEELARAFVPRRDVKLMVEIARKFAGGNARAYATARNEDRIATIVCHVMAQGFCGLVDRLAGYGEEEHGPAHTDYCFASADIEIKHGPKRGFEDIFAAFHNVGGPFMRGLKYDLDGGAA